MVFFTCNNCGESVKKPSVEKHLTQCRKPVFLSCMDCLKDFREDYVGHTRCISELEKYSGKDYVPKESQNKGQKKQDNWLEIVRSILNSNELDVSPAVRGIFQKLQSYDNVPRKKVKFENFVSNSMRCRRDQAEAVWNVLEKALESFKAKATAAVQGGENKNKQTNGATTDDGGADNQNVVNGNDSIENKKDNENDKSIENGVVHGDGEVTSSTKKKKKNKAKIVEEQIKEDKKEETNNISTDNGVVDEEKMEIATISKKKKKNKKRDVENDNIETNVNEEEPVKKKKKESVDDSTLSTNGERTIIEENSSKKRKLQTSKDNNDDDDDDNVINENGSAGKVSKLDENADAVTNEKPPKPKVNEFEWNKVIFKILTKHDNVIPVEKLKKKVLKKYKTRYELDDIPHKVEKTFNKYLRKSGLLVENDVVKTR